MNELLDLSLEDSITGAQSISYFYDVKVDDFNRIPRGLIMPDFTTLNNESKFKGYLLKFTLIII